MGHSCRTLLRNTLVRHSPKRAFHKVIALLVDERQNRMWCEAIGSKPGMEALMQKLSVNALVIFQAPCFKRSPYHSGGRFLDLTRKQKVVVDALPPTDAAYVPLKHSVQKGPCTPGEIADLQGLQNGNKADLTCKICDLNHRIIKENQAGYSESMCLSFLDIILYVGWICKKKRDSLALLPGEDRALGEGCF